MNQSPTQPDLNRRDFLRGGSFASLMVLMGGVPILHAQDKPKEEGATQYKAEGAPLKLGLIGCGPWGRELLKAASRLPKAPVLAISDTHERTLKRGKEFAPDAETFTDYKQLLAKKEVEAVFVATPTHTHKEIVLAALAAGKHVYCEMPMAHSIEDAKAIATAANNNPKLNFQSGLQFRSDPQLKNLSTFMRSGVLGKNIRGRGQWHKKQTWRVTSSDADREKELNWRLDAATSPGLIAEVGIHQIDLAMWYFAAKPKSVSGAGGIALYDDGREVADNVEAIFEFPGSLLYSQACTLGNSFDSSFDLFHGEFNTIMVRERRAWMFKEADAPQLGWEVYAKRDQFFKESGIVLGANSTKLAAQGEKASQDAAMVDDKGQLFYAVESFVTNSYLTQTAVSDYASNFDINDTAALKEYLQEGLAKSRVAHAGVKEGYEATVASLKGNESIVKKQRLAIDKDLYNL
jgi:predicted dehydrogenase